MFTCLAPHAIGVTLPWENCLPLAKQAGFGGIDLEADPKKSAAYYREKFAEYGLRCGGMSLPVNFRGTQAEYEAGFPKLRQAATLAREIGLSRFYTWILSFSDTLTYKQNLAFHAERLGLAAKILADHGCALGLEFLGPRSLRVGHRYPFVRTLEQMLDLCEQVGPNCGVLLDSWHWYTSLGTLEDLRALEARQVVYVHVNDAPLGLSVDRQQDLIRTLPGATGVQDIGGFLDALRSIGYDGPVVPEPFDANLKKLPPEQAVELTGQAMRRIWSMPAHASLSAKT